MNQFKIWQYSLIASVLFVGVIFAMPNIFPSKPALQIALGNSSDEINSNLISNIEKTLNEEGILVGSLELEDNSLTIVLESVDDQLSSRRILSNFSDGDYIIALKSEPSTPKWLREIGAKPLNLGLDLAGGIHFLLEVDTARYSEERLSSEGASLVEEFTKQGFFSSYQSTGNTIDLGYTTVDGNGKTVLTAVGDGIHNDMTNYWYNNNFFRVGTGGELDGANFQGLNSQYVHYDLDSLRVKGDIIATTGSLQGEVFINSPSGSSMFIGKFTGGIPVSGSDNISRYATGSDGSTVDLGFTTLDGDGNSVIVTTGDGIYVDDNNYWYTTGHFKVGSSTNQLNWNTTDLSFTGPLTASGDLVPSVHNTYDLGADSYRWANIYTADLQLSNENATPNEIDGTTGSWTIQEGEDDLYLLNRKNGKKYRFKLEEIE